MVTKTLLERTVERPDPHYAVTAKEIRLVKRGGHTRDYALAKIRSDRRTIDHRTWQERERAIFGAWYPFICAARAEAQHASHVAKAQANLRWRKEAGHGC